ncbi:MAG: hypothetical protein QHH30_08225, partial [candidate division NC10 bacterium]|nr:hypothetical protein [candidate division NC10 bacterium]
MRLARLDSPLFTWIHDQKWRGRIYLFLAVLLLCVLIIPSWILKKNSQRELDSLQRKRTEFRLLSSEYELLRKQIEGVDRRVSLGSSSGVPQAVDDIVSSLGIRQKMRSVRVIGKRRVSEELTEETAEVQVEKLNLNELVNLLYRIKEARTVL